MDSFEGVDIEEDWRTIFLSLECMDIDVVKIEILWNF